MRDSQDSSEPESGPWAGTRPEESCFKVTRLARNTLFSVNEQHPRHLVKPSCPRCQSEGILTHASANLVYGCSVVKD